MLEKKSCTLDIVLDDDFKGIMYGLPEESEGCKLKGKVVLTNRQSITAKKLFFVFIGKITVACGPPMYSSRPEYSETQIIFRKEILFHDSLTSHKKIPCGIHEYYFEVELPGHLPSSFKGTRGRIEYYCNVILTRPAFHSDITAKKSIQIKRSLIDEAQSTHAHNTNFSEGHLDEKIRYQISTPIMTFHDGGLIQTELKLKLMNPDIAVEAVEYGLKERIQYQTTGEQINSIIATVDESRYPLGEERIVIKNNNNDNDTYRIGVNVRLCPWVNCDIDSELISIEHKLSFTVWVSEKAEIGDDFPNRENDRRNSVRLSFPALGLSRDRRERVISLPPTKINSKRSSRTFSLSNVINSMNSQRTTQITKVEKKCLRFETPIIVTAKSARQRQSSPSDTQVDRPPAYAIATMLPPPPVYGGGAHGAHNFIDCDNDHDSLNEYHSSNEYIMHDQDDDDDDDDL